MKTAPLYRIKPLMHFVCPVCKWRITESLMGSAKIMFKEHMKYQHQIGFNKIKFLKP